MNLTFKTLLSSLLVLLIYCGFSAVATAQEDGVLFRAVFVAKDKHGNTDTAIFIVKEGATKGIVEHLGEVNIYGQEPNGPLDLRIIQRTISYLDTGNFKYWFQPYRYQDD
jgi:hypothetical protein